MKKRREAELAINNTTLQFMGEFYPLKNLTRFAKLEFAPIRAKGLVLAAVFALTAILLFSQDIAGAGVLSSLSAVILAWINFRKKSQFALLIETNSARSQLFRTKDEETIDRILAGIQQGLNDGIKGAPLTFHLDNIIMGDNIVGNSGAVVNRSSGVHA